MWPKDKKKEEKPAVPASFSSFQQQPEPDEVILLPSPVPVDYAFYKLYLA
jgi:hypothetical protein